MTIFEKNLSDEVEMVHSSNTKGLVQLDRGNRIWWTSDGTRLYPVWVADKNTPYAKEDGVEVFNFRVSVSPGKVFDTGNMSMVRKLSKFMDADIVGLLDGATMENWDLVEEGEDRRIIPAIYEMGYDSILMYEGGNKTLMLFDPKRVKIIP